MATLHPCLLSLLYLLGALLGCAPPPAELPAEVPRPAPSGDWSAQAQQAIAAGEYAVQAEGSALRFTNRAQGLRGAFDPDGLRLAPREGGPALRLRLDAWGRPGDSQSAEQTPPQEGPCQTDGAVDAFGDCLRQVVYVRPGQTEWWENRPEGLELGFTIDAPPPGDGPLQLDLAVQGAVAAVDGDEATLTRPASPPWRLTALAAWDAAGKSLPAWMEETPAGLRLLVDDADAEGTITVDPLLTTAGWTAEGDQTSASFGAAVSNAGDVNGDGFGDVIVGAPDYDNGETNEGRAFLYLGSASGLSTAAAWTAEGNQTYAAFGAAVSSAGDVNGDGYGDVVVGAPYYDNSHPDEGMAFLYLGSATGLSTTAAWTAESDMNGAWLGAALSPAGDTNGDGYGDLIVGAPFYGNVQAEEGRALVYLGSAAGLSTTAAWATEPNQFGAYYGTAVAGAGDVNGDGYADVLVGAYGYDNGSANEGRAYLYLGSSTGLSTTATWTVEPNQVQALFGYALSPAGDVNGDGYADVIIGAYLYDNGSTDEGRAFVYLGSSTGLATTAAWTAEANQGTALFGWAVSTAGDVNGDGYADVVVGAYAHDNGQADEGRASLYLGSAGGLSTSAAWTAESNQANAYFGYAVSAAGDVNGDGFGDVVIGAKGYSNGSSSEGRASLYLGAASGLSTTSAWSGEADQADAHLGAAVASAGDVNGDGYGDVIVGAPTYDNGSTDEGRAFVYLGTSAGLSTTAAWSAESDQASAAFGVSVAGAGDVNGDGYGDVVIGASAYDNGATDEGRATVYLGAAGGLSTTAAWTAEADQASAGFGASVASAGDVNGDGYADLVVGAPGYTHGEAAEGRAWVYLGAAGGLSTTAAWTAEPDQAAAAFGHRVASAGDVNGDGFADLLVGAPYLDNGSTDEGRASLYLGGASGPSLTADWTAEADQAGAWFGVALAGAGDVNGDGYADVVVGASQYDNGATDEGRATVYLGAATGLSTTAAWTAEADQASAAFGLAVASAGDLNGDGYGDLVIGAETYDNGSTDEGRATVYLGGSTGLSSLSAWTAEADQASAAFGASVASAGDVNGDGYGDLIIGARLHSNGSTAEGRATVYLGNGADGTTPLARAPQARQPGASTPIAPGLSSTSTTAFDVAIGKARGAFGLGKVKLQVEAKPFGQAFDGSGLSTQTAWTSSGLSGVSLQHSLSGLSGSTGYHWRARALLSPAEGRPQGWTAWVYGGASGEVRGGHAYTAAATWYADADSDGYGDSSLTTSSRGAPAGYVATATDCDDSAAAIHPGAAERCDAANTDEDCDSLADDLDPSATGQSTFYADTDGDGYGSAVSVQACELPTGYVADTTDCDDADGAVHPGAAELCDAAATDEDCDGLADDLDPSATGQSTFYRDADADGYAGATTGLYCVAPAGYLPSTTDCDDAVAAIHPGAAELCDAANTDEDCDGLADDADASATGQSTFYLDADSDGYGGPTAAAFCDPPSGYVPTSTDCDDTATGVNPGATEVCDAANTDEDCDGQADDASATGQSTFYLDADGDGYGTSPRSACDLPAGYAALGADCDDADTAYHPDAPEADCTDPNDYNCDGSVVYADADADGFAACVECDDHDAAVKPDAVELPGDLVDQDCDGKELCYVDGDDDGYLVDTTATVESANIACDGPGEADATAPTGDCDDALAAFHPDAAEDDCTDPNDYNCDGSTMYADVDADTFAACEDCDDSDAAINPDADERCDARDNDCDGATDVDAIDATDWYADADADGYTDPDTVTQACTAPAGYAAATEDDCDDADAASYPGAPEVADDGVDQDCDGSDAHEEDQTPDGSEPTADNNNGKGGGCAVLGSAGSGLLGLLGLTALLRRRSPVTRS